MSIVSTIHLTAGGASDIIQVEDQNGDPLPAAMITWSSLFDPAVTITPESDGTTFMFTASSAAVASETLTTTATYSGPGNPNPVTATLTVIVTVPPTVTGLQFDELSGA